MNTDPVCGMQVDKNDAAATSNYNGKDVYFCSMECKEKFDKHPQQYASKVA